MQVVYSEFLDLVNTGNVRQARIDESLQKVYFSVRPLQPAEQQDVATQASTSGALTISAYWLWISLIKDQASQELLQLLEEIGNHRVVNVGGNLFSQDRKGLARNDNCPGGSYRHQ